MGAPEVAPVTSPLDVERPTTNPAPELTEHHTLSLEDDHQAPLKTQTLKYKAP